MSATVTAVEHQRVTTVAQNVAPMFPAFQYHDLLDKSGFGDWRDTLVENGYVVVKGAVPRERALAYRDLFFTWLESFDMGFKRNDPATWTYEQMPHHIKGQLQDTALEILADCKDNQAGCSIATASLTSSSCGIFVARKGWSTHLRRFGVLPNSSHPSMLPVFSCLEGLTYKMQVNGNIWSEYGCIMAARVQLRMFQSISSSARLLLRSRACQLERVRT